MSKHVDTAIIGGGPGGVPAALFLLSKGKSVCLFEKSGHLGGTCLFEGCIPSKIFIESAKRFTSLGKMAHFGIEVGSKFSINWDKVLERKEDILMRRSGGALANLQKFPEFTFIPCEAKLAGSNMIEYLYDGKKGTLEAKNIILATGSVSFIPPIEGINLAITSEELLSIDHIPESMVIIGAGPIGIEAATMFSQSGTKCTIIEMLERVLPNVDAEVAGFLEEKLKDDERINVFTAGKVVSISEDSNQKEVKFEHKGEVKSVKVEVVLVCVGRRPNVKGLGLEEAGVEFDSKGVKVNDFLQTSQEGIYACGDVIGGYMYAHTSTYEGLVCAKNILTGNRVKLNYSYPPAGLVFSEPEIAACGLTEDEAKKQNLDCVCEKYPYKIDARAQVAESAEGFIKFVVDKKTHEILGVHIIGPDASNIISEAALIVKLAVTLEQLVDTIHPHPSLSEGMGILAKQMLAKITR